MLTQAYNKMYLDDAMETLAEMVDFAVNGCKIEMKEFLGMFSVTSISSNFEKGNPKYVAGMSGGELVYEVCGETGKIVSEIEYRSGRGRSQEYWCGWALAYYQWYSGRSFREILNSVPADELKRMYPALHEADIRKFADVAEQIIAGKQTVSNLQRLRKNAGLSQSELAKRSGVTVRSIQMYEQRKKDINHAHTASIAYLARILGCEVEDLLER